MTDINVDLQQKMIKQREHLEKDIETAKDKFKDNYKSHFLESKRIQKEEVELIVTINELKRELHDKQMAGMVDAFKKGKGGKGGVGAEPKSASKIRDILEQNLSNLIEENNRIEASIKDLEWKVRFMSEKPIPKDFRM